jgi:hypothetical protein
VQQLCHLGDNSIDQHCMACAIHHPGAAQEHQSHLQLTLMRCLNAMNQNNRAMLSSFKRRKPPDVMTANEQGVVHLDIPPWLNIDIDRPKLFKDSRTLLPHREERGSGEMEHESLKAGAGVFGEEWKFQVPHCGSVTLHDISNVFTLTAGKPCVCL